MKSERPGSSRRLKVEIPEGLTVEQSIDIIYEYQKQCEREGNYIDAEAAKRKLLQLRGELQRLTREDFIASHQAKKEELERAFKEEVKNFNAEWDSIQRQYEQDIVRAEAELIERHKEEVAAEEQLLLQSLPSKPKESPELINLRKIEENLAKHQNYVEAHKVQLRAKELEQSELQRYAQQRGQKLKNRLGQLRSRQEGQLSALQQRILIGLEEKRKVKAMELQRMNNKFQNLRRELEVQFIQDKGRVEKSGSSRTSLRPGTSRR